MKADSLLLARRDFAFPYNLVGIPFCTVNLRLTLRDKVNPIRLTARIVLHRPITAELKRASGHACTHARMAALLVSARSSLNYSSLGHLLCSKNCGHDEPQYSPGTMVDLMINRLCTHSGLLVNVTPFLLL